MWQEGNIIAGLFILLGLALMIILMVVLVRWARGRSRGVMIAGALLSVFAPDPTLERNIKLVEVAKETRNEEDESGEP